MWARPEQRQPGTGVYGLVPPVNTHHVRRLGAGDRQQALLVEAGGQGLRLQAAGVLQLLDGRKLSLLVVRVRHRKT